MLRTEAVSNRIEVMKTLEKGVPGFSEKYLVPAESIWQPTDFLPDPTSDNFLKEIEVLRGEAKELDHDFWVVLIGDMVTEEALPTYESWLMDVDGVDQQGASGWASWVRQWTAEENRHGDVLNKYIYLSGRVDMREVEYTIQCLLQDGSYNGAGRDPYKNFVYTSFQELATHISHKRVSEIAGKKGINQLAKMCRTIAGDEMRHHLAYREFVKQIISADASEMVIAFEFMMRHKIVMPAMNLRQKGEKSGDSFAEFSNIAQRLGVYTSSDYLQILQTLLAHWQVDHLQLHSDEAERARDYLMALPARMKKITERMGNPPPGRPFKWVLNNGM